MTSSPISSGLSLCSARWISALNVLLVMPRLPGTRVMALFTIPAVHELALEPNRYLDFIEEPVLPLPNYHYIDDSEIQRMRVTIYQICKRNLALGDLLSICICDMRRLDMRSQGRSNRLHLHIMGVIYARSGMFVPSLRRAALLITEVTFSSFVLPSCQKSTH